MTDILTLEEQTEMREEIDYTREMHGDDFIWGKEKLGARISSGISKVTDSAKKVAANPIWGKINEGAQKMSARMQEADAQRERDGQRQQQRAPQQRAPQQQREPQYRAPQPSGLSSGMGSGLGGWNGEPIMIGDAPRQNNQRNHKKQQKQPSKPVQHRKQKPQDHQRRDGLAGGAGIMFGDDHL